MKTTRITYTNGLTGDAKETHEFTFVEIYDASKERFETHVFQTYSDNAKSLDFHWITKRLSADEAAANAEMRTICEGGIEDFSIYEEDNGIDRENRNNWITSFTEE